MNSKAARRHHMQQRRGFYAPGTEGHVIVTQSSMTHMQFVFGAVLIYVVLVSLAIMSGVIYETDSSQKMEPMTAVPANMVFEQDPGQAVIDYDRSGEEKTINSGVSSASPSHQSDKFDRLKITMKEAGVVVPVKEDGVDVPRDIVALAIQDNKNFYPRYQEEFEVLPREPQFDAGGVRPQSMFDMRVPSFLGLGV